MDEQSIFLKALEKHSTEAQAAWLNEVCGDDQALKQRLMKMLQKHEHAQSFLEQPAPGLEEKTVEDASRDNIPVSLDAGPTPAFGEESAVVIGRVSHSVLRSIGNTIDEVPHVSLRQSKAGGDDPITRPNSPEMPILDSDSRYRFDGEIARGGMGAIIKGRDTDLGRDLAIKVLLDSHRRKPDVIQRFVEEAQIGGQLQHPGIAPVYELGQFADQRPYFSMKLVKGETLAKLLADHENPETDRGRFLGIFEQICQTVAYAHSRGVIHRDLKPANIMVGAFGEVQVMDWGLAKVLSDGGVVDEKKARDRQEDKSIIQTLRSGLGNDSPFDSIGSQTQMGSVMGTPAYMPPEQALGEIDQLDERADVFGLGAILCEILTGKPPYVGDDGTQVFRMASRGKLKDGFARLDASGADPELIVLAKHCLELEPADRPRDASQVAERVTGYLASVERKLRETELQRAAHAARADAEAARAVAEGERAESEKRRAAEESKRRKMSLALAACVVLLVGLGSGGWLYMVHQEADRQTAEAAAQRKHAQEMKELADQRDVQRKEAEAVSAYLQQVFLSPDPARDGRTVTVAEMLDRAVERLESDLDDQPDIRARLQWTLAGTYRALGLFHDAVPLSEEVLNYYLKRLGPEDERTLGATGNLAENYAFLGRREEALKLREGLLPLARKVFGPEHENTIKAMKSLSGSYDSYNRWNESLELREKALALSRKVLGPDDPATITAMTALAIAYFRIDRLEDAIKLQEDAYKSSRKHLGSKHPVSLYATLHMALLYHRAGRGDEALKMEEESYELSLEVYGEKHLKTLEAMYNLAVTYNENQRGDEALQLREQMLKICRESLGQEHSETLSTMTVLANSYHHHARRYAEALKLREEALPLFREFLGKEDPRTLSAMTNLAMSYNFAGRIDEGIELQEQALAIKRRVLTRTTPELSIAIGNLSRLYEKSDRRNEALELWNELQEMSGAPSMAGLDRRLADVLGDKPPADAAELISLAQHAHNTRRYSAGARCYIEAFKLSSTLVEDRQNQHAYNAACCAVLAASGVGLDDPSPDHDARRELRRQALVWLSDELDRWTGTHDMGDANSHQTVLATLKHWQYDWDLVSIREDSLLVNLSDSERAACKMLWTRVQELIQRAAATSDNQP